MFERGNLLDCHFLLPLRVPGLHHRTVGSLAQELDRLVPGSNLNSWLDQTRAMLRNLFMDKPIVVELHAMLSTVTLWSFAKGKICNPSLLVLVVLKKNFHIFSITKGEF